MIVHGIGSDLKTQDINQNDFNNCISQIINNKYYQSKYRFVTVKIDWKSMVDESRARERMSRCRIKSQISMERSFFHQTAPDALIYLSPDFKKRIQDLCVKKCNQAFEKMCKVERKFKGKVSLIGHSLGSVITYELLCQQDPSNFAMEDAALKAAATFRAEANETYDRTTEKIKRRK